MGAERGKELLMKYHKMVEKNGEELEYGTREYRSCEYIATMIDICYPARDPYTDWGMVAAVSLLDDFPSEFSEDDLLDIIEYFFNELIISMKKDETLKNIVANEYLINYWKNTLEKRNWLSVASCAKIKFSIAHEFVVSHHDDYGIKFIDKFLKNFFR